MFTRLFLETTDPKLSWKKFFGLNIFFMIIISVIFHTILYTSFFNLVSYIFNGKILSKVINFRLIICLLLIMFFGYIGRLWHSKQTYNDFNNDYEKTKKYLEQHYNSWIFIG
jgi:uncharacterized membrane protein YqjE